MVWIKHRNCPSPLLISIFIKMADGWKNAYGTLYEVRSIDD